MILSIYLLLITFAFIFLILAFAWESYLLFAFDSFMFFILAGLSVLVTVQSGTTFVTLPNDEARVLFILLGSITGFFTVLYKFVSIHKEEELDAQQGVIP